MLSKLHKNERGFTLVEIMIVVAIIGLLAAIAIPNLLRARLNANEGAIKSDLRTFSSAAESFRSAQASPAYPGDVSDMTSANPPYLDSAWTTDAKHGYTLSFSSGTNTYSQYASPTTAGTTGENYYCIDHSGVLTVSSSAYTGADSSGCGGGTPIA